MATLYTIKSLVEPGVMFWRDKTKACAEAGLLVDFTEHRILIFAKDRYGKHLKGDVLFDRYAIEDGSWKDVCAARLRSFFEGLSR